MNKTTWLILGLLGITTEAWAIHANQIHSSKTYLTFHPTYAMGNIISSGWHVGFFDLNHRGQLYTTGFCAQTWGAHKSDQIFLPYLLNEVQVGTDADVDPLWIGLPENFTGTMTIRPKHKDCGIFIQGMYHIGELFKDTFLDTFLGQSWVYAALPVVSSQNNIHIAQSNITNEPDAAVH